MKLLSAAVRNHAEATLFELFDAFELPPGKSTLEKLTEVKGFLEQCGLELQPPIEQADLQTIRSLRLVDVGSLTPEGAIAEIKAGESDKLEFKASLQYHTKKALAEPGTKATELNSEEVLHAALKTVAAYLNWQGGVLYFGINDQGEPVGIENDFLLFKEAERNVDHWELNLRNQLKSKFLKGDNTNDYVRVRFVKLDCKYAARVEVLPRSNLSFVLYKGKYVLYRRQGNQTIEVGIEQVEEFLLLRKKTLV